MPWVCRLGISRFCQGKCWGRREGRRDLPMDLFNLSASSKQASADEDGQVPHTLQPPTFAPEMPILGCMPEERQITDAYTPFLWEQRGLCECGEIRHPRAPKRWQGCSSALGNGLGEPWVQHFPFVGNNTTKFRPGCQIQKSWGERCGFTNIIGVSVMLHQLWI